MKKLLILSSFPVPYRVNIFRELSHSYEIDVFFVKEKNSYRNTKYFIESKDFSYYVLSDKNGKRYFKECVCKLRQYALVLAYDWYYPYAMAVEWKCLLYHIPYVINCDGAFIPESFCIQTLHKEFLKLFFISHATHCFSGGKSATKYFKYYGAKSERITEHKFSSLYRNDILNTVISQPDKNRLRSDLSLPKTGRMFLSIGQFIKRKGFDLLLEAWQELDDNHLLVIIGGGEEKVFYEDMVRRKSYNHVILLKFMPKQEIFRYYHAADFFVLPTREDVWGLVINEAMATGLPVISTNRCNAAIELIENGKNGYIVPVEDANALQEAMVNMSQLEQAVVEKYGTHAIHVIQKYTIESMAESHIKDFELLLENGGA